MTEAKTSHAGGPPNTVRFRLNGDEVAIETTLDARLIDLLRDQLMMTAAKIGCGVGRCGTCLVLLDGAPVNACLLMAWQLEGAEIVSPEGLDLLPEARLVRDGLSEEVAFQCGFCAPGITVALTALFRQQPDADEAAIRTALEGNICRCTGYLSIVRGACKAGQLLREVSDIGR